MRKLSWVLTVPITVICVVFALANREAVSVDLWPLALNFDPPLYVLVLGSLLIGFLLGTAVTWLAGGRTRDKARRAYYRASDLEREVSWLKRKHVQAQTQAKSQESAQLPSPAQLPSTAEPPRASTG